MSWTYGNFTPAAARQLAQAGIVPPDEETKHPEVDALVQDEALASDPSGIAMAVRHAARNTTTVPPAMPAAPGRLVRQETMAAPAILRALPKPPTLKRSITGDLGLVSVASPTGSDEDDLVMAYPGSGYDGDEECSCDDLSDDDAVECDLNHAIAPLAVYVWKCECEQMHPGEYLRWRKTCSCKRVEYCLYCGSFVNNPVYTSPLDC